MILINFKTYSEATGQNAVKIAEAAEKAVGETGESVVIAPQTADLLRIDQELSVFAQHIDAVEPGSNTGSMLPEAVISAGASGTLINHSEKRLEPKEIRERVEIAKEHGITSVVCAQTPEECEKYSDYRPDYIAYEPPELIGGNVSVSDSKPEVVREAVEKSKVDTLTGAGIKKKEDVEKSIELGCKGVLVASGVIKAENPFEEIKQLCEGL